MQLQLTGSTARLWLGGGWWGGRWREAGPEHGLSTTASLLHEPVRALLAQCLSGPLSPWVTW